MPTATLTAPERQIVSLNEGSFTIPHLFYDKLGFNGQAECWVEGRTIIIRPLEEDSEDTDVAVEIIQGLISQGYRGKEIVDVFREIRDKTPELRNDFGDFSVQILNEMVEKGYGVRELIPAFKEKRVKIAKAFAIWEEETEREIEEMKAGRGTYYTMEEVFGED